MFHSKIEIKEGAFLVSDAHYSSLRPELLQFIKDIHSSKLHPTQVIFMGDIFDALFGGVKLTQDNNQEIITLIEKIAQKIEVVYLEGNHDFNLGNIFTNVKLFPISQQPVLATYDNKKVYLAHGDFDVGVAYSIYTKFIRNSFVLKVLSTLDSWAKHSILNNLDKYLAKKNDCKKIDNFFELVVDRALSKYECDYFIEGHFHQNKGFEIGDMRYVNLAAFACNQRYFIVKSLEDKELLEEFFF